MKEVIYLNKQIRDVWKDKDEKSLIAFLEKGIEFFEEHAIMKASARQFLADNPSIRRIFE